MAKKSVNKNVKKTAKKSISEDEFKFFSDEKIVKKVNPFVQVFKEHLPKQIIFISIIVVLIIFIVMNLNVICDFFKNIIGILLPIIFGWVLTYLMSPLYNMIVNYFTIKKEDKTEYRYNMTKLAKPIATIACTLLILFIGAGLIFLFVPQLYQSFANFLTKAGGYLTSIQKIIDEIKGNNDYGPIRGLVVQAEEAVDDLVKRSGNLKNINFSQIFAGVYTGFSTSIKIIIDIFVGIIVMIYTLNMKTELLRSCKRAMFAIFRKDIAQKLLVEFSFAHKVFSGFLVGKLLDSLIIGILCYVCCLLMRMPYTPLISVIVGITNIIPFFGPFIGAIPAFIIIFLEDPISWQPYGFLLFILALQQLDGNVIGPKILGDKTGVGSFWVLFSILLFGGLFGFIGMIIAVPLWAVITRLFEEFITIKLKKKGYPLTTEDYQRLKEYNESLKEKDINN